MHLLKSILLCLILSVQTAKEFAKADIVKVIDDDIMRVCMEIRIINVRLVDIDSPEVKQIFSQQSKEHLEKLCMTDQIFLSCRKTDRYGSLLSEICLSSGISINEATVADGFAWTYRFSKKTCSLHLLQKKARERKIGLWKLAGVIEPYLWRKMHTAFSGYLADY